jgi:hypothetical protein
MAKMPIPWQHPVLYRLTVRLGFVLAFAGAVAQAQSAPVVSGNMVLDSDAVHAGSSAKVAVVAEVASGYHINDHVPSLDYLIPTELKLDAAPPFESDRAAYPKGTPRKFTFMDQPISVYEGRFIVGESLKIAADAKPGVYQLKGALEYQACNDHACLAPTKLPVSLAVKVVPRSAALKHTNSDVFATLKLN